MTIDQIDESNIDENIKKTCKAMEIQSNFCMISEKWIKVETNDVPCYREFGRLFVFCYNLLLYDNVHHAFAWFRLAKD